MTGIGMENAGEEKRRELWIVEWIVEMNEWVLRFLCF
jgi:hypothetical protein